MTDGRICVLRIHVVSMPDMRHKTSKEIRNE